MRMNPYRCERYGLRRSGPKISCLVKQILRLLKILGERYLVYPEVY